MSLSGALTPRPAVDATPCTRLSACRADAKPAADDRHDDADGVPVGDERATRLGNDSRPHHSGEAFFLYMTTNPATPQDDAALEQPQPGEPGREHGSDGSHGGAAVKSCELHDPHSFLLEQPHPWS